MKVSFLRILKIGKLPFENVNLAYYCKGMYVCIIPFKNVEFVRMLKFQESRSSICPSACLYVPFIFIIPFSPYDEKTHLPLSFQQTYVFLDVTGNLSFNQCLEIVNSTH